MKVQLPKVEAGKEDQRAEQQPPIQQRLHARDRSAGEIEDKTGATARQQQKTNPIEMEQ